MVKMSGFLPAAGPAASARMDRVGSRVTSRRLLAGAAALAMLMPGLALAAGNGLSLQGGWIRMLMPSRPAAGYFTLHNNTGTAKILSGASSPACGQLMLHESLHQGGQDRMVMVKSVTVPAHGMVSFAPGGYHLMCIRPGAAMRRGGSVKVTLHFADGHTLTGDFAVKGATGE